MLVGVLKTGCTTSRRREAHCVLLKHTPFVDAVKMAVRQLCLGWLGLNQSDLPPGFVQLLMEKVRVVHPLSTAPTNFVLHSSNKSLGGNCAWCSLGAAGLTQPESVTIHTTVGREGERIEISVANGKVEPAEYLVHFRVPMTRARGKVIYTCSVMLVFKNEGKSMHGVADTAYPKVTFNQWGRFGNLPPAGTQITCRRTGRNGRTKRLQSY